MRVSFTRKCLYGNIQAYLSCVYRVIRFSHYWENVCRLTYRPINPVCTIYYACISTGTFSVVLPIFCYLGLYPECYLLIHHTLILEPMEIIAHQGFGEWVFKIVAGVYLPHLHDIYGNMIPNKMVAKRHGFIVHGDTRIFRIQHHTHIVHKYRCGFLYLDPHQSKVVPEHNIILYIILQCFELGSKCWGLHHGLEFWWPCCESWS